MAFNVGEGVLQKMLELNDKPSRDSSFQNSIDQKSRSEWGHGITHDYRAVGTLVGTIFTWEIHAYKLPITNSPPAPEPSKFKDMRGLLPRRTVTGIYPLRDMSKVDTLCVHYTAAPAERTVVDIANYQTQVQTGDLFPEIAYHLFIEKDGTLIWCHDANKRVWGSGQLGMNERAIHICYSGNTAPNNAQIDGLIRGKQFAQYSMMAGKTLKIQGHKDGYATQCPGATWDTWKAKII